MSLSIRPERHDAADASPRCQRDGCRALTPRPWWRRGMPLVHRSASLFSSGIARRSAVLVQHQWRYWNRGLLTGRRGPLLTAAGDTFFHIFHKTFIQRRFGASRFCQHNRLWQQPTRTRERFDDRNRTMILLDDHLNTFPFPGQGGLRVARVPLL